MITLITGGSASGKSDYAENYTVQISGGSIRYYLATMQALGREEQVRIERHQRLRMGKGFVTIEQPLSVSAALKKMENFGQTGQARSVGKVALLECMSNLTANEMFADEEPKFCEMVADKIMGDIELLSKELKHLVIVTNNVFEDGIAYDEATMEYMRALGSINERLAVMADRVVEVVVGIPLTIKEGK